MISLISEEIQIAVVVFLFKTGKIGRWLRTLLLFKSTRVQILASTLGDSQLLVTPTPGELMASSDLCGTQINI